MKEEDNKVVGRMKCGKKYLECGSEKIKNKVGEKLECTKKVMRFNAKI